MVPSPSMDCTIRRAGHVSRPRSLGTRGVAMVKVRDQSTSRWFLFFCSSLAEGGERAVVRGVPDVEGAGAAGVDG